MPQVWPYKDKRGGCFSLCRGDPRQLEEGRKRFKMLKVGLGVHEVVGLIPGLAQWVKELKCRLQTQL